MAECTDPKNQEISGAFSDKQGINSGAFQVNLTEDAESIFNPNRLLAAVQTYNTLNNVANKMFGLEARWFRAVPQQRSKDVIFKEYTLSCVEDTPLCLKVVLGGNGTFPDSKYQYDLMGLEYELPLEIQIEKRYWEEIAGFGTAPQKKDIVYLPLPNKLYQVESSYLKRGFMEQETTWTVHLRKYQPEASRREGEGLKETIDKYTVGEAELFGASQEAEIERLTADKQMSAFNSTSRDFYKMVDPKVEMIPYNLEIYGVIVAQSLYSSKNSGEEKAVIYNDSADKLGTKDDRALTIWARIEKEVSREWRVISIEKDLSPLIQESNYLLKIQSDTRLIGGEFLHIQRPGALNLFAEILDWDSSQGAYRIIIPEEVESHLNSINSSWAGFTNWKARRRDPINLINGRKEDKGIRIDLFANEYLRILYGSQSIVTPMIRFDDEKWYGIVVNIGNSWRLYNVSLWGEAPTNKDIKISNLFYKTIPLHPEEIDVEEYAISRSNSYLTNIRLFRTTIEEERQHLELLSFFSKDSDQAIILDNCDPKFTAPYISRQR